MTNGREFNHLIMIKIHSNSRNFFLNQINRAYKLKADPKNVDQSFFEMQSILNDHSYYYMTTL
jgi:hypothetical protein